MSDDAEGIEPVGSDRIEVSDGIGYDGGMRPISLSTLAGLACVLVGGVFLRSERWWWAAALIVVGVLCVSFYAEKKKL